MAQKRKSIDVDVVEECGGGSSGNPPSAAARCANGCGFFGNAATGGMCSKCYREHAAAGATATPSTKNNAEEKTHHAVLDTTTTPPAPLRTTTEPAEKKAKIACVAGASSSASSPECGANAGAAQPEQPPAAKNRCSACRKKVGLLGFRCCCGETFCGVHRYAEKHACGFDYKRAARERIAKNNPVVVADKLAKI